MNTNPNIQESFQLKKKAIALLSKAIAKIILKFRLPRNEFISSLDENLVQQAKFQDPKASNVAIAIRTGIDRRYIGKYLKGDIPETKPDKLAVILEDIKWTAHKYYNSNKIPKTGPFKTFQSICELRASGTLTYKAILNELINSGNLKDNGDKVEIIHLTNNLIKNEVNYSQISALQINRIVGTIIYNSNIDLIEEKHVQRTIYSTQINPMNFQPLHNEIKNMTQNYIKEIDGLLGSYEEDVNIGTHPEYGFSFLEYIIENKP